MIPQPLFNQYVGFEMLIKICGVTCPETSRFAAEEGADYIGIILWNKSKRAVEKSQALEIVEAAKSAGSKAVAVFVEESAEEMVETCRFLGVDIVQLHGKLSKAEACLLPKSLQRIFALGVDGGGLLELDENPYRESDLVLLDSIGGGTGKTFNWESLRKPVESPWILAGGLNLKNIQKAIEILQPDGVDVSTGVENGTKGVKCHALIRKFIEKVNNASVR
ncbi:MAG: phosphoribosylanthranilate isomerase [Chlamydiales bacterium]|jgi:phosphoribosylanthranilate isomerase